jgi:hypothetical protein
MILRAMTKPSTFTLFRNYTTDSDEYKHLSTYLNHRSNPTAGGTLPTKQIEDLFLTVSCLYLLIRLNVPKPTTPILLSTTIATIRARYLDIKNPMEVPLATSVSNRLDAIRAVTNKKALQWTDYTRKTQAECLCRALSTHMAVPPPTTPWLLTLALILDTDPKKQYPHIDINPYEDRTTRDADTPHTPPNPRLHFPDHTSPHSKPQDDQHTNSSSNHQQILTPTSLLPILSPPNLTLTHVPNPNLVYTRAGYSLPKHRSQNTQQTLDLLKSSIDTQFKLIQRVSGQLSK